VQPPTLQLDRAPHRSPARETAPPSLLARTRSAMRMRFRGAAGPAAFDPPEEVADITVGAFLESWLTDVARVTVRPRTYVSYRYVVRFHLTPGLGTLPSPRSRPPTSRHSSTRRLRRACHRGPSDTCGASCAEPWAMPSGPTS
jgi:hypothetical protein